jgi:hypothetical protein
MGEETEEGRPAVRARSKGEAGLLASLFFIGTGLCIWWRWHRPERTGPLGGFRCPDCGMVADNLDAFVPDGGAGWVSEGRPIYNRGKKTVTRDGTRIEVESEVSVRRLP